VIPYSKQLIEQDDIDSVVEVLKSSHLTQGPMVERFEQELCRYLGVQFALSFNSATSALYAAYVAYGLKEGDEVLTTPLSFSATSNMLLMLKVKPIFIDIKSDGNIDEAKLASAITDKTKAIVSVDFGGKPVEVYKISEIAKKHNLIFISDSSHALGSSVDGKKVGNFADVTIFSFHAIKPITTGEGGALVTNDPEIYKKAKLIRSHGVVKKTLWNSDMDGIGFNFRLPDINAALGVSQLKKLDRFIEARNRLAEYYDEVLVDTKELTIIKIPQNMVSSRHLYPILLSSRFWCAKEDIFQELHSLGIGVQVHYKPIYKFAPYKELFGDIRLDNMEDFYRAELSLPLHQGMSLEDARFVAENLLQILKNSKSGCDYKY